MNGTADLTMVDSGSATERPRKTALLWALGRPCWTID